MLRLLVREDVTLDIEPCPDPVSVLIDPVQFEQVLVNLVSNARDATPAGGTILIECKARNFPGDAGALPAGVPPGRYAQLDIADSGAGMSPDVAAHAFEPFFTTKPVGSGTGLGLSMVFGAISQSGGFVWIDSVEGKGTRVSLILPVVEAAADSLEEPSTAPPRESLAGLRVLVVEDEDVVRHFVTAVLRRAGAETFTFATPAAVLEDADRLASAVDLIVTDVIMPGMTGTTLVEALRRKRPDLPAVFMSGYATEEESLLHLAGGAPVLEKPFTPADLVARVAEAAGVGS
jgi:two-component system cell cycle sensor histidine kinase/response regulator CckA